MHRYVPDLQPIEAVLASLRLWILDLVAAILEDFGPHAPLCRALAREVRARLRDVQRDLKHAIFLLALARIELTPRLRRRRHPLPGFAVRRMKQSDFRVMTSGVFARMRPGNIRTRIARLRSILDNIEAWTARLQARLERGFLPYRVLAAPLVARVAPLAPSPAPALADTS